MVVNTPQQGWGNHPGKSGHGLINILTLGTGLAKLAIFMSYIMTTKITLA